MGVVFLLAVCLKVAVGLGEGIPRESVYCGGVDRLGLFGYVDRGRIFGFDEVETAGWNGMTRRATVFGFDDLSEAFYC